MTLSTADRWERIENVVTDMRSQVGNIAYPEVAEGLAEQLDGVLDNLHAIREDLPNETIVNRDKLARTLASDGPWTKKRWKHAKLSTDPDTKATVAEAYGRADAAITTFMKALGAHSPELVPR